MSKVVKKVVSPITSVLGLDAPEAPKIETPEVAPVADEAALAQARRRTAMQRSSGRASTVLTSGAGTGKKLGG